MFTPYRRPDAPVVPAPLFDPVLVDVDPLTGAVPTWRLDEEPIYLETLRDLGVPALDEPATPGPVIAGVVFPNPIDDPDEIVPVWLCELGDHAGCDGYACPCCASGECPGGAVDVDDAPPTRALRLAPAPAPEGCPDCGALDPEPCRPKSDPVHGRPLTRQHRRRRAHVQRDQGARIKRSEGGRADFVLVLLVLLLVVTVATGVGTVLAGAVDSVRGPWDVRPCNGTTVCDPTPEPAP